MDWYVIYGRSLIKLDRTNIQPDPRHADNGNEKVQPEPSAEDKENKQSDKQRQETAEKKEEQKCNS
jgi:hypothetical protein